MLGHGVLAGEDHGSSAVTDAGRGPGGHHASLLEHGGQLGELLNGGLGLGVLVQGELHLILLGLEGDGSDLPRKVANLGGGSPGLLGPDQIPL